MSIDPITAALDIGGKLIDRLWPDPTQADAAKLQLFGMQQSGELQVITGQIEINKIEAANTSWWASGWRPALGWVCGAGFAIQYVVGPMLSWLSSIFGNPVAFPPMDMAVMMPLLLGMLGLGGFRTYEKTK